MYFIGMIIQAFILVIAISIDAFSCSFGYGANNIKIPFKSVIIINLICTILLAVGLYMGNIISMFLTYNEISIISFVILLSLGIFKIFDSSIKKVIRKNNGIDKTLKFSVFNLSFIFNIYADPQIADIDESKQISTKEATSLAVAIGIDGLSVGFGIGLTVIPIFMILSMSIVIGVIALLLGSYLGIKISKKTKFDLSWLSGVILIILAIIGVM